MHSLVHQWATDWNIPQHAAVDLMCRLGVGYEPTKFTELEGWSESAIQSKVRLDAAKAGILPWRNNVGALKDDPDWSKIIDESFLPDDLKKKTN